MSKKVSVIMGIYNCADTLCQAIESIVEQTYTNWELIMCDDGSNDNTLKIAEQYMEKYPTKIKILKNEFNKGLNYTLNKCLKEVTGEYVARMDGDDISKTTRFEEEVEILNNNPEIAIVSTDMEFFDEDGVWGRTRVVKYPQKEAFVKGTPFCHAACMVRRDAYIAVGGYSISKWLLRVEDYHLWVKMYIKGYRGINIQKTLYMMRDDRSAQKRKKFKYRINESYVKAYAIANLNLGKAKYIYCLKPILIGLLPSKIYSILHRRKK